MLNKEIHLFQSPVSVGLTFSDYAVRMVRFRGSVDDLSRLQCWKERLQPGIVASGRIKDEQAFTDVLKNMVHTLKVRHKRTFFAVPDSQLVLRQFDLPGILSDAELQNYFFIEIGHKIQLPFERAVFDFHVLDRSATGTQVLLFAAPEMTVRRYQKVLRAAGLEPVSAEFSALGVDRWVQHFTPGKPAENRMYAQLEKDVLNVAVFHGDTPLFIRQISLKDSESMLPDHELLRHAATETDRMLNFYQYNLQKGSQAVSEIQLLGTINTAEKFKKALQQFQSVPVKLIGIDPERTNGPEDLDPAFIPAIGMAMKGAVE